MLTAVPLVDDKKVLDQYIKKLKMKERSKMKDDDDDITTPTPDVNFEKLKIIDDYLTMRSQFLKRVESTEPVVHEWQLKVRELNFYRALVDKIESDIVKR